MRKRWPWWALYAGCASAVLAALAFISRTALRLERETVAAAAHARHQDRLQRALWRMDSLLLPLVSRESARPYFEYLPYYVQERSYTRFLSEIVKGEVLTPSPLLNAVPEPIHLHFQVAELEGPGLFTSPQAPGGNLRDLAEATCLPVDAVPRSLADLERVRQLVPVADVRARVARTEAAEARLAGPGPLDQVEWAARKAAIYKSKREAQQDSTQSSGQNALLDLHADPGGTVTVGSLVPMWLGAATPELFFFRTVTVGAQTLLQGVWLDWSKLETSLLAEIRELLPGARLTAVTESDPADEMATLATIPARVVASEQEDVGVGAGLRAMHATLALAWGAVLVALSGGYFLVRSSLQLSERRSRFASAVTHELRTPLTTFRMYSEMLADGMVEEPAQRTVYIQTLKDESARLATLVENVLAYARLEEGRGTSRREQVDLRALIDRVVPGLRRRASDGGMELVVAGWAEGADGELALVTDVDAVGQVLFNLVDNACKYARAAADRRVELAIAPRGRTLAFTVRDHGPGVGPAMARQIFAPFERGARNGDPTPGVGLGLALARGISRDLGGELALVPVAGEGAAFELTLPRSAA